MRGLKMAILAAATAWAGPAISGDDAFKQAVNYVFSGNVEGKTPQLLSSIVDEDKCIISVETPGNSWLYYLKEIRPDSVMIDEKNGIERSLKLEIELEIEELEARAVPDDLSAVAALD